MILFYMSAVQEFTTATNMDIDFFKSLGPIMIDACTDTTRTNEITNIGTEFWRKETISVPDCFMGSIYGNIANNKVVIYFDCFSCAQFYTTKVHVFNQIYENLRQKLKAMTENCEIVDPEIIFTGYYSAGVLAIMIAAKLKKDLGGVSRQNQIKILAFQSPAIENHQYARKCETLIGKENIIYFLKEYSLFWFNFSHYMPWRYPISTYQIGTLIEIRGDY